MKFPGEEDKILHLGQTMSSGLKANSDIYPTPPINTLVLDESVTRYLAERDAAVAAQAAAALATTAKQEALQALMDNIKANLRYAETTVDFDDDKLKIIGWGGRREKTPMTAPGRPLNLISTEQGEGRIKLQWKKPSDGGKVAAYEILCRERAPGTDGNGEWDNEGTSISTQHTLTGQPRGKELEYGVVAMNKVGEGPMSNIVTAVL